MDGRWQPTVARPAKSKAVSIINPDSGERQPSPDIHKAASSFPASLHPTSKCSSAQVPPSTQIVTKTPSLSKIEVESENEVVRKMNVYARSFIPEALTIINTLDGRQIYTPAMNQIDFGAYVRSFTGLDFLPSIPQAVELSMRFSQIDGVISTLYEQYFRYYLKEEIQAQKEENELYSLYGHDVAILSHELDHSATCSFIVPGLRENSPYIEENDIVELRQLRYDHRGGLLGMQQWLAPNSQFNENTAGFPMPVGRLRAQPAPGWTGIVYNARISAVQRKGEKLLVKVCDLGMQHSPSGNNSHKFNIQFPVSEGRYSPMLHVLPIIQKALQQISRNGSCYLHTDGATNGIGVIPLSISTQPNRSSPFEDTDEARHHWLQSMLFPTQADCEVQTKLNTLSFKRQFFDQQLNYEQQKAIESTSSQNYGALPFLISGPPGTGKTKTIVEIAVQLVKNNDKVSHILLCAPSDPAADTLVQRLSPYFKPTELVRLNRPSRTFAEVSGTVLPFCCVSRTAFYLPPFKNLMAYKLVVTTCRDASLLLYSRVTNTDLCAVEHGLRDAIHPHNVQSSPAELHWTALLIDESTQAMEPEVLIPLSVVAPPLESVSLVFTPLFVMAGDEHQLGPRTSSRSTPLKKSLFARLSERPVYAKHPLARGKLGQVPPSLNSAMLPILRPAFATLIRNYRSHPAILAVPSALFYANTLEPEATDIDRLASWPEWRGKKWPVLFHNNGSEDELEQEGGGWYNAGEAQIACQYAAHLVQSGLVQQKEICIMSPFKAQVQCLRTTIRKRRYGSLWDVDIGPTEAFQGLESGVVILCTTRSKQQFVCKDKELDWGIIGMPNQMNVAITRAKFGLIVIGKREILRQDTDWKVFLDFCDRNELVTGGNESSEGQPRDNVDVDAGELTRMEKVLLAKERDEKEPKNDRALRVVSQEDEMWTYGMQATSDVESLDSSEYSSNEENDEEDE